MARGLTDSDLDFAPVFVPFNIAGWRAAEQVKKGTHLRVGGREVKLAGRSTPDPPFLSTVHAEIHPWLQPPSSRGRAGCG
jgi:hypothetical protein